MGITKTNTISETLALLPQSLELFKAMGLCCVTEENKAWTLDKLCEEYGVEPEELLDAISAMEAGEKSGCLICGKPLVYDRQGKRRSCALCGRSFWAHEECEAGHYVCDQCHSGSDGRVRALLAAATEQSPSALMERLWELPEIHMFGPEHHWLVPCVLLTCYKNCGGSLELDSALLTAQKRGKQVSGGSCGYCGVCGAAIGHGIYFSILFGSTPVHPRVWNLPQKLTAKCLEAISAYTGPRCCKRSCRVAVDSAVKYTAEYFHVEMPVKWSPCAYSHLNAECMGADCPYFPGNERV